jgi:hypothetical protein
MFRGLHFPPITNTDAKAKSFKTAFKCCWNFRFRAGSARQGGPRVNSKASAMPKAEVKTKVGGKERGWTLDVLNIVHRLVSEERALRAPDFSDKMGVVELHPPTHSPPPMSCF